jgi:hypothetical protein
MHDNLLAACENKNYSPAIRAALKIGLELLNKYYSIMDNSEIYRSTYVVQKKKKKPHNRLKK